MPAEMVSSPAGAAPHQSAYLQQQDTNPFAEASGEPATFSDETQWASFETPVGGAASNPFAEIEGQPPVAKRAASRAVAAAEPMPRITPAGSSAQTRQPPVQTTSYADEEFLPPVQ